MTWQPPDIARLNSRLANQNQRVENYLEGVIGRLDLLVDAALAQDWEGVRRWSREITQCGEVRDDPGILESVQLVLEAAGHDENELNRRVMKLIAACGKTPRQAKMP